MAIVLFMAKRYETALHGSSRFCSDNACAAANYREPVIDAGLNCALFHRLQIPETDKPRNRSDGLAVAEQDSAR